MKPVNHTYSRAVKGAALKLLCVKLRGFESHYVYVPLAQFGRAWVLCAFKKVKIAQGREFEPRMEQNKRKLIPKNITCVQCIIALV